MSKTVIFGFVFDVFEPADNALRVFPLIDVVSFSQAGIDTIEDIFTDSANFVFSMVDQSVFLVVYKVFLMVL